VGRLISLLPKHLGAYDRALKADDDLGVIGDKLSASMLAPYLWVINDASVGPFQN
jgi:hypothetical protein